MDLRGLEQSKNISTNLQIKKQRRRTLRTGRKMVRKSSKAFGERTEALRLMGTYYWVIGKKRRALNWWKKSMGQGERLGARPELSRTYMEVGKRLLEPDSKYRELNGIGAEEYLNKARTMFQEMDLQWDLDELEKVDAAN
jgi:hypothetical protein